MASKLTENLQEKLDALPSKPGVYLMKDAGGTVLYVGKAVNLRARLRSYFHASAGLHPKTQRLVASLDDFDLNRDRLGAGGADPREQPHQAPQEGAPEEGAGEGLLASLDSRRWMHNRGRAHSRTSTSMCRSTYRECRPQTPPREFERTPCRHPCGAASLWGAQTRIRTYMNGAMLDSSRHPMTAG
jgi:hypothetical protein